ncbi:MAG: T9SS type A sorting domain-containing protein [Ignavibacteriales bacterium]|nr:T9SS type A sorting domain-containing protein [Ignavibacteriales bacterium]
MKKIVQLMLMALLFSFFTNTFAQIMMDKDDADWADVPILFEAPDNLDGVFPTEVGAVVTDIVDIKEAKVVVVDNVMFGLLRFWGGPAWPNNAYQNDHDGTIYPESRGYYHFLIDVDNDVTTGWKTSWYEAHYTPVGYLESLGQDVAPIGAEIMQEWGARTNDKWKQLNDSVAYARGLDHWAADYSEYDGQTDLGDDYEIFNISVPDPDSAKIVNWEGAAKVNSSDDESLVSDYYSYWIGHAWGNDFLEFGFELTPLQKYFANKGMSVLNPGDVIGICGMTETPIDDWGVDMTTRGEYTLPDEMPKRPEEIVFDGDDADWTSLPVLLEAPDNLDGVFPTEVGAVVSDRVDIKEVKAKMDGENIFWLLRMWGGPCWPNEAYQNDHDGTVYPESRGYYHVLLDIDNDATTGWMSTWYEAHYTPVGYLESLGQDVAAIGTEVMLEWGGRTNDAWKVENEGASPFRGLDYWAADYSEYDGQTDLGSDYEIFNYSAVLDSTNMMRHNGLLLNNSSDDAATMDGNPDWMAHAWGNDFIEVGMSLRTLKMYFKNKTGVDYFNSGDVIGICGMNETPIDDWGVDMTTRGELSVITGVNEGRNQLMVDKFELSNNYPNPFNPTTNINFTIPKLTKVSVVIYNNLGQKVRTLVNNKVLSGNHTTVWNGRNDFGNSVPSGVYYYRLEAGSNSITKSMVLLK